MNFKVLERAPGQSRSDGNWRVTFGFAGKDAERVDYEDYH